MNRKRIGNLIKNTASGWVYDHAPQAAAAVAFYAIFSLAPLAILLVQLVSFAWSKSSVREMIFEKISGIVSEEGVELLNNSMQHFQEQTSGLFALSLGIVIILFGATTVIAELQSQFNRIWKVTSKPGKSIFSFFHARLLSLGTILLLGALLLSSLIIDIGIRAARSFITQYFGVNSLIDIIHFTLPFILVFILFTLLFKYLPDVYLRWRDVAAGGLLTTILFVFGKSLIGWYLSQSTMVSAYGAAGALVVILLWVYYTAQIIFIGAEFIQARMYLRGSKVLPKHHAEFLRESDRIPKQNDT